MIHVLRKIFCDNCLDSFPIYSLYMLQDSGSKLADPLHLISWKCPAPHSLLSFLSSLLSPCYISPV